MEEGSPDAKMERFQTIVTLRVGPDAQVLLVHSQVLQSNSGFFKAALKKAWLKSETPEILLPEDDAAVVTAYFDWLYSTNIPVYKNERERPNHAFVAKLYVYGEKIQDDALCNAAIKAMYNIIDNILAAGVHTYPGAASIKILYEGTPEGSPARQCMVDLYKEHAKPEWLTEHRENWPQEFLCDLSMALLERSSSTGWRDHGDEYRQYFKKK